MKKQTGIWIDLRNAYLVIAQPEKHETPVTILESGIEESAATGGTRDKTPWGPQGGDQKRSAQERRKHEEKDFFTRVIKAIPTGTEEIVILGPAKAKFGLKNAIEEIKNFSPKIVGVETAAKMSAGQLEAWVLKYFAQVSKKTAALEV